MESSSSWALGAEPAPTYILVFHMIPKFSTFFERRT